MQYRIGNGIDYHRLEAGIPLVIGGVSILFPSGSKGHSDGDVLFHAIVDAILGSLAMGDIGQHFPSDKAHLKNASSRKFLEHAFTLMTKKGFLIENIDATIILQKPQLSLYIDEMRKNIAHLLSISYDVVSVKATTTDHLGFTGSGRGIAATAMALLAENDGN